MACNRLFVSIVRVGKDQLLCRSFMVGRYAYQTLNQDVGGLGWILSLVIWS